MFQRVSARRDAHPAGGSEATVGLPRRAFRFQCLDPLLLSRRPTVERIEEVVGVSRGSIARRTSALPLTTLLQAGSV